MAPSAADTKALLDTLDSTTSLLSKFTTALSTPAAENPTIDNPPNPLHILRDAAKLLKAHVTKISLFSINDPFTPTALAKIIADVARTCLPAMMSAAQICTGQKAAMWGALMGGEVKSRVGRAFRETKALLDEVRAIAKGEGTKLRKDSLSSTGLVWEACDALVALDGLGIAGVAVLKAEEWRDTIKDAIEELQEWREGDDEENEGFEDDFDDGEGDDDADSMDDMFNAANSMPKNDEKLAKLVEDAEGKLKKVVLLYNALVKRRLKTFKTGEETTEKNIKTLDDALEDLKSVPNMVDELAGSFYDLDEDEAKKNLDALIEQASKAAKSMRSSWEGKEDEFTAWSKKWEEAMK